MPDEIWIDLEASDRALDQVAKWHAARPQAEKDEEYARLLEMRALSRQARARSAAAEQNGGS
jgi:hypothetical protein